jgi:uncharacterized protein YecT (DUF1311 family)
LRQFGNLLFVRLTCGALLVLFAFVVTSKTVAAADWPENYIVHEHSESPDGHYGVLVLSQQAAIDQYKTDGNTTYLVNLQTRKTLGEIRGTDYFENQNHRDLEVLWAPDSSTCVLQYDGRYGFDSVLVLELKDESFRQIDIGKHIQKTLDRLFEGYVSAYFRFAPDHKLKVLKVRALSFTNPKALPDQPSNYAVFQGTFDLKAGKWTQASAKKTEEYDALQAAYQDDSAKQMIVAANPADVPENFTGSVFSSEQEKLDALDKMMNDVYQAVRSVLAADRFTKVKQDQIAWLQTRDAAQSLEAKSKLTESRITKLQELLW